MKKSALLLFFPILLSICTVHAEDSYQDSIYQSTNAAWEATKLTSVHIWEDTKEGTILVWDTTKKTSAETWRATKNTSSEIWAASTKTTVKIWESTQKAISDNTD